MSQQVAALFNGPFDAHLIDGICVLGFVDFTDQCLRDIDMERARQEVNLSLTGDGLESRNDGNGDARFAQTIDKAEVLLVVEEHLGDDIVSTRLHLLLQVLDIDIEIGRLEMFLRISRHTHAEIGGESILDGGVEVLTVVQVANHGHEFRTVAETIRFRNEEALSRNGITTQGNHILNAEEVKGEQSRDGDSVA